MFFWRQEITPGRWVAFTNAEAGNLAHHVQDEPTSVRRRRRDLEGALGVAGGSLRFMHQTHSADAVLVHPGPIVEAVSADAQVSPDGSVPLAVMTADCVPVVLSAGRGPGGASAVIHAGRQGVLTGVVANTVELIRRGDAKDLTAWIGPAICGLCYEVPEKMRREVAAVVPAAWATTRWGTPGLDLPGAVRSQLATLGVEIRTVTDDASALCTLENESLYSHRRSPAAGRFAGLVWTS
ncbi:polyphenol oxidase family protein [Arthrobacter sp. HLT1-21]